MSISQSFQDLTGKAFAKAIKNTPYFILNRQSVITNDYGDELSQTVSVSLKALNFLNKNKKDFTELPVSEGRIMMDKEAELAAISRPEVHSVEKKTIGGVPCRVYREKAPEDKKNDYVLVYLHGGGWVLGSLDSHDTACRYLANVTRADVVSVDYRLAPEHVFPAGLDDVNAVLDELLEDHTVVLAGDSAGGNLALASTISRIQEGKKLPKALGAIVPVTNLKDFDTDSYKEFEDGFFLTKKHMEWYRNHYLGENFTDDEAMNPLVSPLFASDEVLSKFPTTLIAVAGFDPLRDEGTAMFRRLRDAGVEARFYNARSMVHPFVNSTELWYGAEVAMYDIGSMLGRAFYGDIDNLLW